MIGAFPPHCGNACFELSCSAPLPPANFSGNSQSLERVDEEAAAAAAERRACVQRRGACERRSGRANMGGGSAHSGAAGASVLAAERPEPVCDKRGGGGKPVYDGAAGASS